MAAISGGQRGPAAPLVTVAVCLHNSAAFIEDTLESVFAQTFRAFEVVLVDDGSTDGCAELVRRRWIDERLAIHSQRHSGLGAARQRALSLARGEYIAFLDHDDLWMPEKLERQLAQISAAPGVELVFSDCFLIDAAGRTIGRLSDRHDLAAVQDEGGPLVAALLTRGCFIDVSTVLARTATLRALGGFNPAWRYVEDYDMWLRVARNHRMACSTEPLAKRRIHAAQFTQQAPLTALEEETALLRPLMLSRGYPEAVQSALRHYLFGQHRDCAVRLWRRRSRAAALRAACTSVRYPGPFRDLLAERLRRVAPGRAAGRVARAVRRRMRRLANDDGRRAPATHVVWFDGTSLGDAQTGYFNFVVEGIRRLAALAPSGCRVHVRTSPEGRAALREREPELAAQVDVVASKRGALHWSAWYRLATHWSTAGACAAVAAAAVATGVAVPSMPALAAGGLLAALQGAMLLDAALAALQQEAGRSRAPLLLRTVRFAARMARIPWRRSPHPHTTEVIVWRGRFRYRDSVHIAVVQDLTTRIHPELHTEGNVAEFEEFLQYALRHADIVATVSETSRRDILQRLPVFPGSVHVLPGAVSPSFVDSRVTRSSLHFLGICEPYVLAVGCLEPRKNLRRLVRAFELLRHQPEIRDHVLVLAGPPGWDDDFGRFLVESDARPRVRQIGFVAPEHLPSLYHFASAVVMPSLYEGFGLPVLEAMCCGGAVLASRAGALPELLGEDGMLFDAYSTDEIAAVLLRALSMAPAEAAAYRARCCQRAHRLLAEWAELPPLPGVPTRSGQEVLCGSRS